MRNLLSNYYYLIILITIINCSLFCRAQKQGTYVELIKDPIDVNSLVINHYDLPLVKDELTVTLKMYLASRSNNWTVVFHKGRTDDTERTPTLLLTPNVAGLHARYSITNGGNVGIDSVSEILLNRWYHIAYTLSDPEKRMDIFIDGKWAGFSSIVLVQSQSFVFTEAPLFIGKDNVYNGFSGQISNFRYYNYSLSPAEVQMDYLGQDPTTSNTTNNCPTTAATTSTTETITIAKEGVVTTGILAGSSIGSFFCGMVFLAGSLFIHKVIKQKQNITLDKGAPDNRVVFLGK